MSDTHPQFRRDDKELVPKFLVQAMVALMLGSVALVGVAQYAKLPNVGVVTNVSVVKDRTVTLVGARDGAYSVLDDQGNIIAMSSDDKAGFIGVIGLSVNRERTVKGMPLDAPVRLVLRDTGHMAIIDDSTGWTFEMLGYGSDNVAAFTNLLK